MIHGEQPRLLEFDGIDIETPLEGNLLVCRNLDVPGVIGKHRNHSWRAGRQHRQLRAGPRTRADEKPVKALAVVQVDAPVSGAVLEALDDDRSAARSQTGPALEEMRNYPVAHYPMAPGLPSHARRYASCPTWYVS